MTRKSGIKSQGKVKAAEHAERTVREYLESLSPEKLTELVIEDLKEQRQRRESGDQSQPPASETAWRPGPARPVAAPRKPRATALQKA